MQIRNGQRTRVEYENRYVYGRSNRKDKTGLGEKCGG
jgi:hypothetical protein